MRERNYSISILRVIGMFSIVMCHFTGWLGISFLQQLLNYGVFLFLFISGYLYANKNISNYGSWFFSRLKRILIPYYIFTIPIIVIYYCYNEINLIEIIKYLFCLQGINFINDFVPFTEIEPLGNLWFITIILLCYLLTIVVKKIEMKHKPKHYIVILTLVFLAIVPMVLQCLSIHSVSLIYFVSYFVGYYIAKFKVKSNIQNFINFGAILFVLSIIIRLVSKHYLDNVYNTIYVNIVLITQLGIAVSLYFIISFLTDKIIILQNIAKSKPWNTIDNYSYVIYITHYAFLHSITSVDNFGLNKPLTVLLFLIFTVISAIVVYQVQNIINRVIN